MHCACLFLFFWGVSCRGWGGCEFGWVWSSPTYRQRGHACDSRCEKLKSCLKFGLKLQVENCEKVPVKNVGRLQRALHFFRDVFGAFINPFVLDFVLELKTFRAAQHINFISPQNADNGDPKIRNRDGPGNSGKFRFYVEFPQKPSVQVIPGNSLWGPHFQRFWGNFSGGNENGQS